MIIDLPQNVVTIATQNAQNKGMATNDYIAKLIEQDSSKTAHQIKGEMTAFYYNIDEMDKALQAPRVTAPHFDTPEELMVWMENLTDADFTEYP